MQYHVNGELVPDDDATVTVDDRGFLYGDAAFETVRAYDGTLFEWEAHLERLQHTCSALGMPDAVPTNLEDRVSQTLEANGFADAYVRVSITRGVQPGKLTPQPDVEPTVVIIVSELPRSGIEGNPVWDTPAVVETVETRKIDGKAVPSDLKTHNYLNGILARLELRTAEGTVRADEALLLDNEGFVTEGTTSNVFFVDGGTLHTPHEEPILPGVTRRVVLDLAREAGITVETGRYRPERLRNAEELFLTNTTGELWPVDRLDEREVGSGAVTERLTKAFDERIEEFY
ncbi:aminotransferase class IV [Halanaeroarchaeum sulfurireducens]|uniref:Aminodeoxychorismate lyase n=1 Tax=Halanaeroarchaeum sulfurireducens TaxID=1604004 RepID=A0A0F7PGC4_9EURY|nr:aminotransferase class IV [Halanaeroarchaeum sulfurireducens]AKH98348.1 aminodeoxychorismate lyase [Halanaeroarchaeum sulfurireducens]ALG82742.1 aminodeoxychorismate lyase [Halanaeroarchaeum sulfurireducens]